MKRWFLFLLSCGLFFGALMVHWEWTDRVTKDIPSQHIVRESPTTPPSNNFGYVIFGVLNAALLSLLFWSNFDTKEAAKKIAEISTKQLNEKNEELQAVINSFPGMISWIDQDLNYLGVNNKVAQTFGSEASEFPGKPVGRWSNIGNGAAFRAKLEEFMNATSQTNVFQWAQQSPVGEQWFLTTMQKYQDSHRVMVVSMDITQQKQLELEIEEARAKALHTSRLSALGEVAGGMAHEINNPLMIIYAKATILKKLLASELDDEKKQKCLDSIQKIESTIERISKIIRGLRTIARDGENDPFQAVSLQSIVNDTMELCSHRVQSKNIQLRYPQNLDPQLAFDCRATQVVQVLLNLINNAVDALEGQPNPWIQLDVQVNEEWVDFRVIDSGPGIPENIREKIMQPFYTTKEIGKGTGLGLSISQGIAQSHKGSLTLASDSTNTTFSFKLPRYQLETDLKKAA